MKRIVLLLACLTVILVRVEDALWNPVFGIDKLNQLAGAINLLEGHGVSYAYAEAQAPAVIHYEAIVQWPPGYPWLAAVGIFLTSNLYYAVILNDLFFVLLQLVSAAWLISLLPGMSSYSKMLWFCAFAFNTSLVTTNTSVDTAAMGGYTLALACVLYSIQQPKGSLWAGIAAGLALTFCLVMRYSYLPQAFLIPAMLALIFLIEKNKDQLKFLVALTATLTLLTGFAVYWLLKPGSGIKPGFKGFFPEHLIRFGYGFIYEGFFSVREWRLLVAAQFGSAGAIFKVAVLITRVVALTAGMAAMIALILSLVREVRRLCNKRRVAMSATIGNSSAFPLLLFGSMGCNVLLLVCLSLTNPMQTWAKDGWTFVQEARYYVPSWLSLWIAGMISLREKDGRQLWNSIVYWIPTILLAVNVVAFGYYKRLSIARQPDYPYIATCASKGLRTLALSDLKSIPCGFWR
jgi:hypothetical protein